MEFIKKTVTHFVWYRKRWNQTWHSWKINVRIPSHKRKRIEISWMKTKVNFSNVFCYLSRKILNNWIIEGLLNNKNSKLDFFLCWSIPIAWKILNRFFWIKKNSIKTDIFLQRNSSNRMCSKNSVTIINCDVVNKLRWFNWKNIVISNNNLLLLLSLSLSWFQSNQFIEFISNLSTSLKCPIQ